MSKKSKKERVLRTKKNRHQLKKLPTPSARHRERQAVWLLLMGSAYYNGKYRENHHWSPNYDEHIILLSGLPTWHHIGTSYLNILCYKKCGKSNKIAHNDAAHQKG